MTEEENKQTPIETPQEQVSQEDVISTLQFFSNPVRVNMVLYDGIKLILSKLEKIEEKLDGNKK
jgi:hypothetical protein